MTLLGAPDVRIVLRGEALQKLLRGKDGPVARDLLRRGGRVQTRARQLVGVKTGRLRRSIGKRLVVEGRGVAVHVGSSLPYALTHHEGTRPHDIDGNPLLVFRVGETVIFAPRVRHPGTRPNPFLRNALPAARG